MTTKEKHKPMVMVLETFTKASAKQALTHLFEGQRPAHKTHVEMLRQKMNTGRYQPGPETMAFDVDGKFIDGQHRLRAFIASTLRTLTVPVIYNAPRSSYYHLDQGRKRSTADATGLSMADSATLNSFLYGPMHNHATSRSISGDPHSMLELSQMVGEGLDFMRPLINLGMGNKAFFTAPTRGVLLRAYMNGYDHLDQFIQQVKSGEGVREGENAIVRYRDFILRNSGRLGGRLSPSLTYQKTQSALFHWLEKSNIKNLVSTSDDLFPLSKELIAWIASKTDKPKKAKRYQRARVP